MHQDIIELNGLQLTVYSLNTVIVGSGAAGLNAADRLYDFGQKDIAVVTEGLILGTSRNTGSDKQTYYKQTAAGNVPDSVYDMAQTLYDGGAMHGDIALVEAALSARCFYRLIETGVPFPHNRYGEYIGYKTDHDPKQRATSAGPLTSKFMTEKLLVQVKRKEITIFDGYLVIGLLTNKEKTKTVGFLTLNLNGIENSDHRYVLFNCTNIIYATGGPAGMYGASVYPVSQTGASGVAFESGVKGKNLTEWQFGIASVQFRWNLSGTYQQVLPRYVSTNPDGGDEHEFLDEYFDTSGAMLDAVFLKGYQWPFDVRKVRESSKSSLIDILVYHETVIKERRVFLDYTRNPSSAQKGDEPDFTLLGEESYRYLTQSEALFGRPIDRLIHMNKPAYELFKDHGFDLKTDYLEIAVCAQHNNGGLYGDIWWESNLKHFFPVGEVNGTHGVYRPGGSALNAGQVGGLRAAQFIAHRYKAEPSDVSSFLQDCESQIRQKVEMGESIVASISTESTVLAIRKKIQQRMDRCSMIMQSFETVLGGLTSVARQLERFFEDTRISTLQELPYAFKNYDLLLSQYVYLKAISSYIENRGTSRGSFMVCEQSGELPAQNLPDDFRFVPGSDKPADHIQVISWKDGTFTIDWEPVRPIPDEEQWFENVWNDFMGDGIIG
ncbi:MAG: FAD-binding protein [Candidatus Latescibacteria bacterium]|nr:FAD-binding protein [Candidatus Latescibacterota bacterium]